MTRTVHLLAIDPQNDFCDLPAAWHSRDPHSGAVTAPALPVPGAHADMQRLAAFIRAQGAGIDHITVTLDSHQRYDVGHVAEGGQAQQAEWGAHRWQVLLDSCGWSPLTPAKP